MLFRSANLVDSDANSTNNKVTFDLKINGAVTANCGLEVEYDDFSISSTQDLNKASNVSVSGNLILNNLIVGKDVLFEYRIIDTQNPAFNFLLGSSTSSVNAPAGDKASTIVNFFSVLDMNNIEGCIPKLSPNTTSQVVIITKILDRNGGATIENQEKFDVTLIGQNVCDDEDLIAIQSITEGTLSANTGLTTESTPDFNIQLSGKYLSTDVADQHEHEVKIRYTLTDDAGLSLPITEKMYKITSSNVTNAADGSFTTMITETLDLSSFKSNADVCIPNSVVTEDKRISYEIVEVVNTVRNQPVNINNLSNLSNDIAISIKNVEDAVKCGLDLNFITNGTFDQPIDVGWTLGNPDFEIDDDGKLVQLANKNQARLPLRQTVTGLKAGTTYLLEFDFTHDNSKSRKFIYKVVTVGAAATDGGIAVGETSQDIFEPKKLDLQFTPTAEQLGGETGDLDIIFYKDSSTKDHSITMDNVTLFPINE